MSRINGDERCAAGLAATQDLLKTMEHILTDRQMMHPDRCIAVAGVVVNAQRTLQQAINDLEAVFDCPLGAIAKDQEFGK
jgi:hypothetical protein